MVQRIVQISFLAAFVALTIMGRVQLWVVVFVCGLIGALLFGRLYCGWLCPINTIGEGTNWLYRRLRLVRRPVPGWLRNPVVRFCVLLLFVAVMIITARTGKRLPVLPLLTVIGTVVSLVFVPALWHRFLCPYGTLLRLTGSVARKHRRIQPEECIECGKCQRVCPSEAIRVEHDRTSLVIDRGSCLECGACARACPKGAIHYS